MKKEDTQSEKSFKWIFISFAVSVFLFGSLVALVIYAEDQKRPGYTDNIWYDMVIGAITNPYVVPVGLIGIGIVGLFRIIRNAGGFSPGGKI